jgi:hypothetical protein
MTKNDFVDLVSDPNRIVRAKAEPRSNLGMLSGTKLNVAYCKEQGKKGLIWTAEGRWTEVFLLTDYIKEAVQIEHAEALDCSDTSSTGSGTER